MYLAYQEALLQSRAYRTLRSHILRIVEEYQLSIPEWTLLGLLVDHGSLRVSELAKLLDVEVPHVTVLVHNLLEKGYVSSAVDEKDSRAKRTTITAKGKKILPKIEAKAATSMVQHSSAVTHKDLESYYKVLDLVSNSAQ